MSAAWNKRAANESTVGHAIKRGELAYAIKQNDGHIIGDSKFPGCWSILRRTRNGQLRAPNEFAVRFVDEFGGGIKTFRFARRQNQKRFGIFALQRAKGN